MSITERQQEILEMLEKYTFCTVSQLAGATYTSPSSIRRDLAILEAQGRLRRTHGGASAAAPGDKIPALQDRLTKNVAQKRAIAKKAATLLRRGQKVMLDGSSTASFLLPYIAELTDMTLFTNSMTTAIRAVELGIVTHCIGGRSVRRSPVLAGEAAYEAVAQLHVDILFFSSQYLSADGVISDSTQEENYLRQRMLEAADTRVFLCDSEKFGPRALHTLTQLKQVDAAVFDKPFPELKNGCRLI